ncbi:MAG: hypothetical protein HY565_01970 [Candidatus Kerfeldbacteria bacterium]|nr:hypothetical protein [Candidatus Kerfeldbacteria bacterium]
MLDRKDIDPIRKRTPDKRGEEGRIYFFGTPENPLVLKEWYRTHRQVKHETEDAKRIPVSPFHHKAVFYEMTIIHELFPDHTVGIVGGVDPRLTTGSDGEIQFDPTADVPMTVTKRAQGDTELLKRYDAIVDAGYAIIHGLQDNGLTEDKKLAMYLAGQAVDHAVVDEFGPELINGGADVATALATARAINPTSIIVKMLERGITPVHPQFNFVPRQAKVNDLPPYGTFVELRILDPQRLSASLANDPAGQTLKRKLARWQLFDRLDRAYLGLCELCPQQFVEDATVQRALVETLLVAQQQPNLINLPYSMSGFGIQHAKTQAEVLAALRKLRATFDKTS